MWSKTISSPKVLFSALDILLASAKFAVQWISSPLLTVSWCLSSSERTIYPASSNAFDRTPSRNSCPRLGSLPATRSSNLREWNTPKSKADPKLLISTEYAFDNLLSDTSVDLFLGCCNVNALCDALKWFSLHKFKFTTYFSDGFAFPSILRSFRRPSLAIKKNQK